MLPTVAGLLDDANRRRICSRVRSDPQAQHGALNRAHAAEAAARVRPRLAAAAQRRRQHFGRPYGWRARRRSRLPGHVHPVRMTPAQPDSAVAWAGDVVSAPWSHCHPAPSAPTTAQHITVAKTRPDLPPGRRFQPPDTPTRFNRAAGRSVPRTSCLSGFRLSGVHAGARAADRYRRLVPRRYPRRPDKPGRAGRAALRQPDGLLASTVVPRACDAQYVACGEQQCSCWRSLSQDLPSHSKALA